MRTCRLLQLATFAVLVGCAALTYAQDEKKQDAPPAPEATKPEMKQDDAKPQQPDAAKPTKEEKKQEKEDKKAAQEPSHDQSTPAGRNHGQPAAAAQGGAAGKGGHIPDDKFKAHFGRSHTFTAKTVIVSGQPQFSYGGYTFELVDAWPVGWAFTDECYIDYIDGEYFLFDLLHPGVQVAIFVVL